MSSKEKNEIYLQNKCFVFSYIYNLSKKKKEAKHECKENMKNNANN